jgi:hypothetical protein
VPFHSITIPFRPFPPPGLCRPIPLLLQISGLKHWKGYRGRLVHPVCRTSSGCPLFIQKDRRIPPSVHIVIGHHRVHTEIFDRTEFSPRHLHGEKFVDTHTLCMGSSGKHPPSWWGACFLCLPSFLIPSHCSMLTPLEETVTFTILRVVLRNLSTYSYAQNPVYCRGSSEL